MSIALLGQRPIQFAPTPSANTKLLLHGQNILDYSGNNNLATATGNATSGNSGSPFRFGGVLNLNGGYIDIADSTDFNFGSGDFLISFRMNQNTQVAWARVVENEEYDSATNGWHFSMNTGAGNKIGFQLSSSGGGGSRFESDSGLSTGTWYWVVIVKTGNTVYMYIDGVRQTSTLDITGYTMASEKVRIGATLGTPVNLFYGDITEVVLLKGSDGGLTGSTIDIPKYPYKVV